MKEKRQENLIFLKYMVNRENGILLVALIILRRIPRTNLQLSTIGPKPRRKKEHSIGFRLYRRNEEPSEETLSPSFLNNALNVTAKSGNYVNL